MRIKFSAALALFVMVSIGTFARSAENDSLPEKNPEPVKAASWYDKIQIRGYAQFRYNGLFVTNPDLKCDQCDKSWGGEPGFFFRRIRFVFFGQIHPRVYFYIQPDFASGGGNFGQIRDAYIDLGLDEKNEFRIRFGQSKMPFGFENLQSSQNRLPLDRDDALNSGLPNERDLGVLFYYAPEKIRKRFSYLTSSGLKGSGDYGVFGLGIYNGQGPNNLDQNETFHVVSRLTYPFQLASGQIIEGSLQAYAGKYVIPRNPKTDFDQTEFRDFRYGPSLIIYPQPFGLQMEYNWGRGPEYDPEIKDVKEAALGGGYVLASYMIKSGTRTFIPFSRYQYYKGGKKFELDATKHRVKELEIGVEWQFNKNFELVTMYTVSNRTFENSLNPDNTQKGSLLRLQAQVNF
ncbi:porin [Algoriphagus mannitolivorans]|uniref:porin n=1 Tax=Algoriphagus mannitolivorans TaxID=226504 RepID=UPI00041B6129|nr:porin [Algoriphagus mannitolivorans]